MEIHFLVVVIAGIITAATPLLFAGIGELVAERAGVLNLGVEGMMAVGAASGFAVAFQTGNPALGVVVAALAGGALAFFFAVSTLGLLANQVAAGLALTLLGLGLSSFIGGNFSGQSVNSIQSLHIPVLSDLPVLGELLFSYDILTYLAIAISIFVWYVFYRTRTGLDIRAVGETPFVANEIGLRVQLIRYCATVFGGAMAGLGGAYISLAFTPIWNDGLIAGRGWIALALVVFATWRPGKLILGAYLFGAVTVVQLHAQALGIAFPSELLSAAPYIVTVVILVIISRNPLIDLLNRPRALGREYHPEI